MDQGAFNPDQGDPASDPQNVTELKLAFRCSFANVRISPDGREMLDSDQELEETFSLCDTQDTINLVFPWLVILTGIPGNILALLTIFTMRRTTGTFYILLMAASDLATIFIRGISAVVGGPWTTAACKVQQLLSNYSGSYANWVLVLICFERFFTIRFPLQKNYYYTVRRAYVSAVALFVILLPFHLVHVWAWRDNVNGDYPCALVSEYAQFYTDVWMHVTAILYAPAPAVLLLFLIILIANQLKKIQSNRRFMMIDTPEGCGSVSNQIAERQLRDQARVEQSLTLMLFVAAISFVLLTMPMFVVAMLSLREEALFHDSPTSLAKFRVTKAIASGLNFITHAVNFFIYFLSASRFRSHLWELLQKFGSRVGCKTTRDHTASTQVASPHSLETET